MCFCTPHGPLIALGDHAHVVLGVNGQYLLQHPDLHAPHAHPSGTYVDFTSRIFSSIQLHQPAPGGCFEVIALRAVNPVAREHVDGLTVEGQPNPPLLRLS